MKLLNNLALMSALGFLAVGTMHANPINFYASGSFTSCSGCIFQTVAPSVGDSYPNNEVSYTTGTSTITINYADLATALNPAIVNAPTFVSYGFFNVDDSGATAPVNIGAFTFDLVLHDNTDNGTLTFTGSSAGGVLSHNQSNVIVSWSPTSGPVANSTFSIFTPTQLVPPTTTAGQTTIQGFVNTTAPEPASLALIGGGLLGLGLISRRKLGTQK